MKKAKTMKGLKKKLSTLPTVNKSKDKDKDDFPVKHLSYSSLVLFGSNPVMFKITQINRDTIESTTNISAVIGNAFHNAMETYYGGNDQFHVDTESEAIEAGLKVGTTFLEDYNDGFIAYSTLVPTKQKALELFVFLFTSYVAECPYNNGDRIICTEEQMIEKVVVEYKGRTINLPVKLKGYADKIVYRKIKGEERIVIVDYKTTRAFSDPEKIDGAKMIQAATYYFLVYAKYGVAPYSIVYEEVKMTKNKDGGPQVQRYEVVYEENELFFDLFFRYYGDVVRGLNGEQVYVPNLRALFDGDIAIISYINRLDDEAEIAAQKEKLKIESVTDILKHNIENTAAMKRFLQTIEKDFSTAKSLNYESMKPEEKITTKMTEHALLMKFDSVISGRTVDLYRFNPSIGLKMSRIHAFTADLEQVLGVSGVRVLAPIPNSTMVGVEVPRSDRTFPDLPEPDGFNIAIGENFMGEIRRFDIRTAPHMLVAGSSGSGKSVFLHSMIRQLMKIPNVELHLFDPKQVEFDQYDESVTEYKHTPSGIYEAIKEMEAEMERRYTRMKKYKTRNIEQYNSEQQTAAPKFREIFPYKVIIVDEYANLAHHESVGVKVQNIAQKGRACGIHIIIATQRASTKIISGDIKVNFPVKIVLRMAKEVDSRVMIDEAGAEKLLGKGDMLFVGDWGVERLQGYNA